MTMKTSCTYPPRWSNCDQYFSTPAATKAFAWLVSSETACAIWFLPDPNRFSSQGFSGSVVVRCVRQQVLEAIGKHIHKQEIISDVMYVTFGNDSKSLDADLAPGTVGTSDGLSRRGDRVLSDLSPPAKMGAAMATVFVVTAGSGDTYRIERVYLDRDEAHGFAQDYNGIAPVEPVQVEEWQDGAPPAAYDGPYWRAEWWARVPVAKRRGALRHTDEGERFDDFAIRQEWWTGEALPEAKVVRRELAGVPKVEVVGLSKEKVEETVLGHDHPGQGRPGRSAAEMIFHSFRAADGKKWAWRLDIAAPVRHDRSMDRRALERLGHHVVSRRVALGYRNRTDLADSLQFTVRTLADIEHGVRKASPGTYAMLENKLAWAPGSIDTILAGGEPNELVSTLRRTNPNAASQGYALRPTNPNALSQVSTEELLLELRRRIIAPRDQTPRTPGTTGTAA